MKDSHRLMECDFERGNIMENEKKPNFIKRLWQALEGSTGVIQLTNGKLYSSDLLD